MEQIMILILVILIWMFASASFMLVYKITGEESKIEIFLLYLFCFPWLVIFVIGGLISTLIEICEKKINGRRNK